MHPFNSQSNSENNQSKTQRMGTFQRNKTFILKHNYRLSLRYLMNILEIYTIHAHLIDWKKKKGDTSCHMA